MSYGIKTVVGGFGKQLTVEEQIPYTLARTHIEHQQLSNILYCERTLSNFSNALELGCGYGRNFNVLEKFADTVTGLERDPELLKIAQDLNPKCRVLPFNSLLLPDYYDLILTFTFLQHLSDEEMNFAISRIHRVARPRAIIVVVEETDPSKSAKESTARRVEEYLKQFKKHGPIELIKLKERILEPTFPDRHSGHYMVFRK